MVFKSTMMIRVATELDVPIKLKIPNGEKMSILGLGDIVIPGVLLSWGLKFDVDTFINSA